MNSGPEPGCLCGTCQKCKNRKADNKIRAKKYIIAHRLGITKTTEIMKIRIKDHGDLLEQQDPKQREIRDSVAVNSSDFKLWSNNRINLLVRKAREIKESINDF